MNVFETVKGAVTTREAAEMYGITVKRNGMAVCPFHDDRNPSMKVDKRFHCFGCGEDGDVIDFTAKLYNLSPKEAAEKLAQDFGLDYDSHAPVKKHYTHQKTDAQILREKEQHCFLALTDYFHQLKKWKAEYAPTTQEEAWNDLFVEAVQNTDYVEYLLNELLSVSTEEKKALIAVCEKEINKIEQRRTLSMPEKISNKDRLREITENIETGIKELFESDKYRQYLSTMSRFHRYSLNNTMLIYLQKPDATLVAGFNKWVNQFERHVKKGEHGITIIAPTPFKKKIEEQKLDPDTKAPVLDKEGKIVTEEKEVEIPMFRPVKVFDVSQTDGKPLPQLASDLSGNVQQYDAFMEALRRTSPVPMTIQPIHDGSDGYFSLTDQRIAIREGMSEVQTVSAAVHEITHSILHNREKERMAAAAGDETKEAPKPKDRHTEEVEAESVSYAVRQYYGIQTGENSFGYIATWSNGKELPELKASLETINKTASGLITEIDRHFAEVCKERGIDLSAQQEAPAVAQEPVKEEGMFRYYISPEALNTGTYPFMEGSKPHEEAQLTPYENSTVQAFGYIDYPQALTKEQVQNAHLLPAKDNPAELAKEPEPLTYYVAECMEFPTMGEYHENLTLPEALRLYETIPASRMNGIKGIGFELNDDSDYAGEFPILNGKTIDLDTINSIAYFRDNPLVQKAVSDLIAAMPEMEVLRPFVPQQDEEALFLVDDANYLHIQTSDEGYDYTIYDAKTKLEVDGGCLANPDISLLEARKEIFEIHGMQAQQIEKADVSLVEELQDAQPMPEPQTTSMLPEAPEQMLDKYPMPDTGLTQEDIEKTGYLDGDMLPLSKEMAQTLLEQDFTVYALIGDGGADMLFDADDFADQPADMLFAVSREEWEASTSFNEKLAERMEHQPEREQAFLSHEGDCFAIYQLQHTEETRYYRFEGMERLQAQGLAVEREHYDLIYTASLIEESNNGNLLDKLYEKFNLDHPADYRGHSLSVSDIVVLKQAGEVSCHYVDSYGFTPVPDFIKPENYLKAAELATEDDYGMIDGIINNGSKQPTVAELEQQARTGQPISLMDLASAVHRERQEKKKSVVKQLHSQTTQETKKTAPKRSAEREL